MTDTLLAWLLTYLLHSTALLAGAWLIGRLLGERRLALQEAALRAALVGGLLTASLQVGLELRPAGGRLTLPARASTGGAPEAPLHLTHVAAARPRAATPFVAAAPLAAAPTHSVGAVGGLAALVGWIVLTSILLVRLLVAARRLRRMLRGRQPLTEAQSLPGMQAAATRLGLRLPVRYATAPALAIPLTRGVLRPEICLPARVFDELPEDARLALCAHEMAHVARRDPAWLLVARLVEMVAPFQPLNHWARRRLEDLAECLSDDLAVRACDRRLGLARSLLDVASWTLARGALLPATAVGAFRARSRLAYRVERIMDHARRPEHPRRMLLPIAAVLVLTTALVLPVVSRGAVADVPPPTQASADKAPAPAPPAAPRPPAAPKAPKAPVVHEPDPQLQAKLDALQQKIDERMKSHEGELHALEAKIAAAAERSAPNEAQIERMSQQIAEAASRMATLAAQGGTDAQQQAARSDMDAARKQLQEALKEIHIPSEEMRALQEQARAIAEATRPTTEELAEINKLSKQLALESMPDGEEMARIARDAAKEVEEAMRNVHVELEQAREEAHKAMEDAHLAAEAERARQAAVRHRSPEAPEHDGPEPGE